MDVQAIHSMAPAARVIWYASGDCSAYDGLNRAVADNRAGIITNSWNASAHDDQLAPATRTQFEDISIQAAVQGQAILFSSGDTGDDSGSAGAGSGVRFPATSPWITAVGGTTVGLGGNNQVLFTAGWEGTGNTLRGGQWVPNPSRFVGGAGGGRSAYYSEPDYQHGVVPDAVAGGKRAVPDIAALADGFTGMAVGMTFPQQGFGMFPDGGTSLSSPLVAGIVATAAQAHGGGRLGFLNPALYQLAGTPAVADVTPHKAGIWLSKMTAPGGITVPTGPGDYLVDVDVKPQTLQSGSGWDPVTGIGTPTGAFAAALVK
jgi:subtilase family serine protease